MGRRCCPASRPWRKRLRTGQRPQLGELRHGGVHGADALPAWKRDLLCDPQTSGGLLVAVDPAEAETVLNLLRARGFDSASVVGRLKDGPAGIEITDGGL